MLLIDVNKLRNRHFHLIGAPDQISLLDLTLVLYTLGRLVILQAIVNGVGDLRKGFPVLTVAELLFLDLNLVGHNDIALQVHCLDQNGYDEFLHNILLLVVDTHSHMRASIDFVAV